MDEIRLEPKIDRDTMAYAAGGPPLLRVLAKLKAGKPVTIVTMGDSLTDKRHWANREVCWIDLLRDRLKNKYKSDVMIVNPAIGGTQFRQNVILIPRWLATAAEPDLVTIFFGGNDWDAGMRGEEFRRTCADAVDRVRRSNPGQGRCPPHHDEPLGGEVGSGRGAGRGVPGRRRPAPSRPGRYRSSLSRGRWETIPIGSSSTTAST